MNKIKHLCNTRIIMVNKHFALQIKEEWKTAENRRCQWHFLGKTDLLH